MMNFDMVAEVEKTNNNSRMKRLYKYFDIPDDFYLGVNIPDIDAAHNAWMLATRRRENEKQYQVFKANLEDWTDRNKKVNKGRARR